LAPSTPESVNRKTKIVLLALASAAPLLASAAADEQKQEKQAYIDKTFSAMDANRDGRVDKAEFSKFQQARFKKQAASIDAAFDELDKDKDGKISKTEATVVPDIAKYFDGLDTDKDGFLSRDEMQKAIVAAQTAETTAK